MSIIAVIMLPLVIGACIVALLGVPAARCPWRRAFQLSAGLAIGLSLSASAFFASVAARGPSRPLTLGIESAAALGLAALVWRTRGRGRDRSDAPGIEPAGQRAWVALFAITLAAGCTSAFLIALLSPHGQWDAWAIWNLRARLLFRDGGAHWADIFSPLVSHSEYPPLLPLAVARGWLVAGAETPLVPISLQAALLAATALLLAASLAARAGRWNGMLAAMYLATSSWVWQFASWQYADGLVALGLLGAIACLHMRDAGAGPGSGLAVLEGFFAGFVVSAKNEGLIPMAALLGIHALRLAVGPDRRGELGALVRFGLGAAPALIPALAAKAAGAPGNDLVAAWVQNPGAVLDRLTDPSRYAILIEALRTLLIRPWEIGFAAALAALLALRALRPARPLAAPAFVLAATAIAYLGVLLITPHDLAWHVRTTIDRLFSHLVPAGLFILFSILPGIEEAWRTVRKEKVTPEP